jgi:hypothetical protein
MTEVILAVTSGLFLWRLAVAIDIAIKRKHENIKLDGVMSEVEQMFTKKKGV